MGFNILPVFGREKEKETIGLYLEFSKLMLEINEVFFRCTKRWIDGDYDEVEKLETEVAHLEKKGDEIVRVITQNLYTGAFLPGTRGHMHRFSIALDDVMDNIKDTAGIYIFMKKRKFSEEVKNEFWKMLQETRQAVRIMSRIIEKLFSGEDIIEDLKKAKGLEHSCDLIKRRIFELVLLGKRAEAITWRLICDTASSMASITDAIEFCCVQVTILKLIRQA
ncbi:MAG: TIGR00153 family protein [Candidatus Woesearchaeota archaeon]